MFRNLKRSLNLLHQANKVLLRHPSLVVPVLTAKVTLLMCWVFMFYPLDQLSDEQLIMRILSFSVIYSSVMTVSCMSLLVMVKNLETGYKTHLFRAIVAGLLSLRKVIFLALFWAMIWLSGIILDTLLSAKRGLAAQAARSAIAVFQKTIRMMIFLILPGVVWQNLSASEATNKGFEIFRQHHRFFISNYLVTELAAFLVLAPLFVIFLTAHSSLEDLPNWGLQALFVYLLLMSSYLIYTEQLLCAQMYLHHLKWQQARKDADLNSQKRPRFEDIQPPSLLDNVLEFKDSHNSKT